MSTLQTNTIQHLTSGFNNIVTHTDGAGTVNAAHARAWVNFNGTGVVAIRAQFNVSSITDNGTGDYTVNFSNAMSDANYAAVVSGGNDTGNTLAGSSCSNTHATNSFKLSIAQPNLPAAVDRALICVSVFR